MASWVSRGVWALGGAGSSSLWAHGFVVNANCNGPNSPLIGSDKIPQCGEIALSFGGADGLAAQGMSCGNGQNQQATARSMHDGGVHALFVDSSVHFIGDYVDIIGAGNPDDATWDPSVWDRMNLSKDGELVENDMY
ncbi:hypothetical protein LCGC14_3148990 [marine sediment metagenome]|uniref:DUF1559 domain-containing protein n=1 Tax=marine sediment metagenome TaxID=412755 RepID=A0A0F8WIL3_9ZZZZ